MTLVVAAAQAVAVAGDVGANVATAARLVGLAAARDVRVLVLPEAFVTGYDESAFAGAVVPAPAELPDLLAPLVEAAVAAAMVVVVSTPLRRAGSTGENVTMTMLVVHPDGTVSAPYDKQHLDADETPYFTPGDHGASVLVDGVELGLSICYDSSFPEHARHAAGAGALGYLSSAAFFPGSEGRRDLALAARAADNVMYVVAACATGTTGRHTFVGGSAVYDPDGVVLSRLDREEGLAVAVLDPEIVAATRLRRRMLEDLRPQGERVRVSTT